jgi:ABC-type uncharacterized transport system ATPase subunit
LKKLQSENDTQDDKRQKVEEEKTMNSVEKLFDTGARMSLEQRRAKANLECTIVVAIHGLSATILDGTPWCNMINTISSGKYMTPSRYKLGCEYIPTEALDIQQKQHKILSSHKNLLDLQESRPQSQSVGK